MCIYVEKIINLLEKKIKCNFTNIWVCRRLNWLNYKLKKNVKLIKYICKSSLIIKWLYLVANY
jgi:hypothetical protein